MAVDKVSFSQLPLILMRFQVVIKIPEALFSTTNLPFTHPLVLPDHSLALDISLKTLELHSRRSSRPGTVSGQKTAFDLGHVTATI